MTELQVELYGRRIGGLSGDRDRFDFTPDPDAIRHWGPGSTVLSIAIPLVGSRAHDPLQRGLRRNFFEEILAEGRVREQLGSNARLDPENTMGLLRRYGRDVAGAVQIWDPSDPEEPRIPEAVPVTDERIAEMLAEARVKPLGNNGRRRLSSLAGVQDKVLLAQTDAGCIRRTSTRSWATEVMRSTRHPRATVASAPSRGWSESTRPPSTSCGWCG